jgi:hypothetical protein
VDPVLGTRSMQRVSQHDQSLTAGMLEMRNTISESGNTIASRWKTVAKLFKTLNTVKPDGSPRKPKDKCLGT